MKTIIYIRGFNHDNSPHSTKFQQLSEYFNSEDYEVFEISTNFLDVEEIKQSIEKVLCLYRSKIDRYEDLVIIGNSMGGFLATYLRTRTNAKTILVNPAIFYNSTNGVKLPKEVYTLFDALYAEILDDLEKEYEIVFLSKNDSVINPNLFLESRFKKYTKKIIEVDSDHRFDIFPQYFDELGI